MSKEISAKLVERYINMFRCPICHSHMKVEQRKSLVCTDNHTFDFAKQGYVNLMTRPANIPYDKQLFSARRSIIMESNLYTKLHDTLAEIIRQSLGETYDQPIIYDAGCGEGSHLQCILTRLDDHRITGVGLDISKEAIRMAAANYKESIWLVADLAQSPFARQSCQVILNILSPANYQDFKRVLAYDGVVIKVVPGSKYLIELREVLYDDTSYDNEDTVSLFKNHFQLVDTIPLNDRVNLSHQQLQQFVRMSPLAWNATEDKIQSFLKQDSCNITIDLEILVGKHMTIPNS